MLKNRLQVGLNQPNHIPVDLKGWGSRERSDTGEGSPPQGGRGVEERSDEDGGDVIPRPLNLIKK